MTLKDNLKKYFQIKKQISSYKMLKEDNIALSFFSLSFFIGVASFFILYKYNYSSSLIILLVLSIYAGFLSISLLLERIKTSGLKFLSEYKKLQKNSLQLMNEFNTLENQLKIDFNNHFWIDMIKNDYKYITEYKTDNEKITMIQNNFKKEIETIIHLKSNLQKNEDLLFYNWPLYFYLIEYFEKNKEIDNKIKSPFTQIEILDQTNINNKSFNLDVFL